MNIIKEFVILQDTETIRYILRSTTYAKTMQYLEDLVTEARKDFTLNDLSKIEVMVYGGDSYEGTYGIEFEHTNPPPAEYVECLQVELRLA